MAQEITGSNPVARPSKHPREPLDAPVAQRIEYWASNPGVAGSNPARRTIIGYEFSSLPDIETFGMY